MQLIKDPCHRCRSCLMASNNHPQNFFHHIILGHRFIVIFIPSCQKDTEQVAFFIAWDVFGCISPGRNHPSNEGVKFGESPFESSIDGRWKPIVSNNRNWRLGRVSIDGCGPICDIIGDFVGFKLKQGELRYKTTARFCSPVVSLQLVASQAVASSTTQKSSLKPSLVEIAFVA